MQKNWQTLALAIFLAVATWYLVTGREKVEVWLPMSVEMTNPPSGLTIRKGMISTVEVRVRGPKGLVRSLDAKRLSYPLDVSSLKPGDNVIDIDSEKMPFSRAFEVVEIKPTQVILSVDRIAEKKVSVIPDWLGQVPEDYRLLSKKVTPEAVVVRGPESVLKRLTQVRAQTATSYDSEPPEAWDENVSLTLPPEVTSDPGVVRLTLLFGPKVREVWVKVPLTVRAPAGMTVRPSRNSVSLQLEVPLPVLKNEKYKDDIGAVTAVDAGLSHGRHDLSFQVRGLPDKVRVLKKTPETVTVTVTVKK